MNALYIDHARLGLVRRGWSRSFAKIAAAFVLLSLANGQDLSESAKREIAELLAEKDSRTAAQLKMSSSLVHAAKFLRGDAGGPNSPVSRNAMDGVRLDASHRVEVEIQGTIDAELLSRIANLGGAVVRSLPEYDSLRALVPPLAIEQIADLPEVQRIRPLIPPRHHSVALPKSKPATKKAAWSKRIASQLKPILNQIAAGAPASTGHAAGVTTGSDTTGDIAHQANYVRNTYGFTGAGVKIGVVSDGVDNASGQKTLGFLPPITIVGGAAGSGDEGTALLEIIYSLAPGASLYFASSGVTQAESVASIQALATAGCSIILDDNGFINESAFQDSSYAKRVNLLAASGVFYFSAVGNLGNLVTGNSGTWQGDFSDGGASVANATEAGNVHSFNGQNYDVITTITYYGFYQLDWADPSGASNNDYDLFVLDPTGTRVIASSTNVQNGSGDPTEEITDLFGRIGTGSRLVVIKKSNAAPRALWLQTYGGTLSIATTGAAFGHSSAAGAFSIAATDVTKAHGGAFTGGSANQVENYSADGPRKLFFNSDGSAVTPGNFLFATNGGVNLNKPDFTAADMVPSGLDFFTPFGGTSASTPHAAAIAALVKQANPTITVDQMRSVLAAASLRIGASGFDPASGAGIVMAPAAILAAAGVQITVTSAPVTGLSFTVTGAACSPGTYTSPTTLTWIAGTQCQVQWTSPQGSTPYSFVRWQDSSSQNPRTFTVPNAAATLTATMVAGTTLPGVPVTVSANPAGIQFSVDGATYSAPQSFRWDAGTSHTLTASSPQTNGAKPYVFQSWSNGGTQTQAIVASASVSAYTASFATFTNPVTSAIAHFAAGATWTTGFLITNKSTTSAVFSLNFFGDGGLPLALPFGGAPLATLGGVVAALGSAYYEAGDPQSPLVGGWAQITADPSIVVQALFRNNANGTFYEAAAPSSAGGAKEFLLPFDATTFAGNGQPFYTGFAVANLDQSVANVNCTARGPDGIVIPSGIAVPALPGMGHWANYLFPALAGKRGTIDCVSNTNVAAIALRFIGTDAFSSLPVTVNPATYSGSAHTALAHFAAGDTWTTGFFVTNTGGSSAQFSIAFRNDSGTAVALPFSGGPASTLSSVLPAHGSAYFEAANPQSPLAAGWGQVTADPTIVIQALFRDNASGTYYEAAVPSGSGSKEFVMPFDATTFAGNGQPFYTGFAIANLDASAASITCTARDLNGVEIPSAVAVPSIAAMGHWANYLFPALTGMRGTIDCVSNTNMAATALHFIGTSAFSSLQVISK